MTTDNAEGARSHDDPSVIFARGILSQTDTIDTWADEGGLQLVLHRFPSGKVLVGIDAVRGPERERLAVVTIARFRLARIAQFLVPEEEAKARAALRAGDE